MASVSNSAIESIVQYLTKAAEAAKGLDAHSQNLCFALGIACSEAGRVAKIMRKAPAEKKAAKSAKKPAKAAAPRIAATPAKQSKSQSRRKPATLNGAVAH